GSLGSASGGSLRCVARGREKTETAIREALAQSKENVVAFARASLRKDWMQTNAQGGEVGERFLPFERVGIYVPGGSAPLVSTSVMTVALASAAGVPEIVVTTPCGKDGKLNPALLHALKESGATEIYKVGGAQAIGALSIGTASIAPVCKIFGPGNSFVVEAKRQAFGEVSIDLLPGPSEILVLADASGNPDWIASDLLAQAEHDPESVVGLVTDSAELVQSVESALVHQAAQLSRSDVISTVLEKGTYLIQVPSFAEGVRLVNAFAPEHLSFICEEEDRWLDEIKTAGAIFVGNHSPVAAGDFLAGPSHTLPTGGAGKSFPGLTVDMFQRRTSIVKLGPEAIAKSEPVIRAFCQVEGLDAHARSASIRLEESD
ncbi:MAG: histidinol dehydrogenase, partial [Verrucomicrobiota bacterium]